MNLFRTYYDQEDNIVDVFKQLDFSSITSTDSYNLYEPYDTDNLMTIAYKFYKNVDDAWVIYIFNKLADAMFAIIPKYIIDTTVAAYIDKIIDYDNTTIADQRISQELVREYYMQDYDFDEAATKAIETLSSPSLRANVNFTMSFQGYLYEQLLINERIDAPLKIPTMSVVLQMKAYMNKYSIAWKKN